jgi:hypothetical protein
MLWIGDFPAAVPQPAHAALTLGRFTAPSGSPARSAIDRASVPTCTFGRRLRPDAIGLLPSATVVELHADAVGRRRLKWAAYGGRCGIRDDLGAGVVAQSRLAWFETLSIAGVVGGIMPIGF